MLKALSVKPHEHILSYLVTWAQSDDFYVLLPCAERNLRVFMQTEPRPDLTAEFVLWFLQELRGIADGVRSIHHLNSQAMQGLSGQPNPQGLTVPQQRRLSGFHHDLKPDNILLFAGEGSLHGVMKIADFGTGKISAIQSGVISFFVERNQGTETYEAPDVYMYKKASRPQDMWSMGCIILELMYWAFIDPQPPNRTFSTERFDSQNDASDAFWMPIRDEKGSPIRDAKRNLTVALKPAVANRISQLKEICKDKRAFSDIMTEIDGLLNFSTSARIPARQLYDDLDAIVYQATIDLDENPDCYIEDGNFPTARATPPSPVPSTIGYGRHVDRDVIPLPAGVLGEPAHYPQPAAAARSLEFANVGGHPSLKPPESPGKGGSHAVAPASKYSRETRHEVHTVDIEKQIEPSAAVTALRATRFDKSAPDHAEIDLDHLGNAQPREHSTERGIFPWNKKTSGMETSASGIRFGH
jgi:serine/threonine protein kinase